ncbi:hypothetical protein [Oceaniovalibus sp. ACAM 378]|uniref:hypothetical protein n=1 Tax=Oceaniovalibus sp. ACAM 378 TaxID=2599923 RepID=UPI0011D5246D|nr:hypothetical protein [Oceaniovalibus sp. ACAM 378]TYB86042.1 hypothetical protein FQ320_17280 [Oceaniovalibus sp. ACAM 378]
MSTHNAMLLGNGLIAHVRMVQSAIKKTGKPPKNRYLTYTDLIQKTGATVIPIGIGQQLDHVMDAIHAAGVPEKMRGLTLFVTDASGFINYSGGHWYDITAQNSKSYREAVLEKDWSEVEFMFANAGN